MKQSNALEHAARIWAFDGGGPDVISQLLIVDEIMNQIQWILKLEEVPRPCDYAELMVGTGLGALTAILLARLRLTARQALDHTVKFGQRVFTEPNKYATNSTFQVENLIAATRNILTDCGLAGDAKMIEDVVVSGKTYVAITAVPTSDLSICRLLRSYHHSGVSYDCSIVDAISATMAIPEWFPPATIGSGYSKEELIGGSVGFNNPTKKAIEEGSRLFGSEQLVSVIISLSSGQQRTHGITKHNGEGLQQALTAIAQEGRSVADDLAQRFPNSPFYHRFCVQSKTGGYDVTAWDDSNVSSIASHTKTYVDQNVSALTAVAELVVENKGLHTLGQLTQVKSKVSMAKSVPRLSPYYVAREDVYNFMHLRLVHDQDQDQRLFVIYGMGGVGKTQLASYFQKQNKDRYKYIFFVDASSVESIKADLQSAIRSLGEVHSQDTFEDALRFLVRPDNSNWLVIFDNADDPKLPLARYLPECDHGTVIITSRNRALAELAPTSHWHLQGMDESNSIQVLFKAANREGSKMEEELEAAAELYRLLGGLPLALVHVGSYCHMTMILLSQYLERFKAHRSQLLTMQPPLSLDKYSYSTYTSIGLSHSLLDEHARSLLHLLTFFHPSSISLDILRTASNYGFSVNEEWVVMPQSNQPNDHVDALTRLLMPDGSWSDFHIDMLLHQLQTFSLISLSHSDGQTNVTIHPLVQSCIRDTLSSTDHSLYFYMTVLSLSSCSCEKELALFPHLSSHITELESCKEDIHPNDLVALAFIVFNNGNYEEAMTKYEKVGNECRKVNGVEHKSTLRMPYWTVHCLEGMGRYEEAEEMIREVVKIQEMALGEDADDTIDSHRMLANILRSRRKTEEAENILRRMLIVSENKNGQEHWVTLQIHRILAANLLEQHRSSEAEAISKSVLPVMKKILGEDNTITLKTSNTLSLALMEQGKWTEAENILSEEVARKKIIFGRNHPETLISLYDFALCLIQREELDETESILQEVLEFQTKTLGKDYQRTINAREKLEEVVRKKEIRYAANNPSPKSRDPSTLSNRIFLLAVILFAIIGLYHASRIILLPDGSTHTVFDQARRAS